MALWLIGASPASSQEFRPNEDVVADPQTGAALMGYDPVLYFLTRRPQAGSPQFQSGFAGKTWYFRSEANKAAFEAQPDLYMPGFGGHDPVAVASGLAVAGSPKIFAIRDGRIYLFRRAETRETFLAKPEILAEAENHWPEVKHQLITYAP